jgi:hypothetical protein
MVEKNQTFDLTPFFGFCEKRSQARKILEVRRQN